MKTSLVFVLIGIRGIDSFQPPVSFAPRKYGLCKARSQTISRSPTTTRTLPQHPTTTTATTLNLSISTSAPLKLAATAGLSAAGLQWVLAKKVLSNKRSPKVLRDTADYTAHSVVALFLMVLLSTLGVVHWWFRPELKPIAGFASPWLTPAQLSSVARILDPSTIGTWMAAVVLGSFALWDIPTSIRVKALRKPDVIAHHCVMMVLALLGCTVLPMQYIVYYFGVVELSSIPLIVYDQVAHWIENIKQSSKNEDSDDSETTTKEEEDDEPHPLEQLQGNLGILAGVSFTLIRVVSFTKVTLWNFIPDCLQTLKFGVASSPEKWAIRFLMMACGGFMALQWYWFSTMVKAFQEGDV